MNKQEFISEISKLRTSAQFLTLHGYRNAEDEVSEYQIVFKISYKSALERSIALLSPMPVNSDLEIEAKEELLKSWNNSLEKIEKTTVEEINDGYERFFDETGAYIKGVKMLKSTGELHIYGSILSKNTREPGNYRAKNSKPLTNAKNILRDLCPVSKFRQFKVFPSDVESIIVGGQTICPATSL